MLSGWLREKSGGRMKMVLFCEDDKEGCNRCGAMTPLKKRKGRYHYVCKNCEKELDNGVHDN